ARVAAAYVVPDGTCTATTRAPSSGARLAESMAIPATAPVVTRWASTAPVTNTEKTNAATMTRPERTIQRMNGPLFRRTGSNVPGNIRRGESGPRWGPRQGRYVGALRSRYTAATATRMFGPHAASSGGRTPPAPMAFASWNISSTMNVVARLAATPHAAPLLGVEMASGAPNSAINKQMKGIAILSARSTYSF